MRADGGQVVSAGGPTAAGGTTAAGGLDVAALLDASPVATLVVRGDLTVVLANPAAARLVGPRGTVPGASPLSWVRAGDLVPLRGRCAVVLATGEPARTEVRFLTEDGRTLDLDLRLARLDPTRLLVHLDDVTPERDATAALLGAGTEHRTAFEAAPIGMALLSPAGHVLQVNAAFVRLLGRSEPSLLGVEAASLVRDEHLPLHGGPTVVRLVVGDEGERVVRCSVAPAVGATGEVEHLVLQCEDLTALARSQEHLRRTIAELERTNESLEAFAHVAAHDLRAPLGSVRALLETVQRTAGDTLATPVGTLLDRAVDATVRMGGLIEDLLAFAAARRSQVRLEPVSLGAVVRGVLDDLAGRVSAAGADVRVAPLPEVRGDPVLLRQLVQNLVANALTYHRPGERPLVRIAAAREGDTVELHVTDAGIGIPVAERTRVFTPFTRLHGREEYEGTGVGLAICAQVAALHGGTIEVADGLRGGTTVVVRLRAA